MRKVSVAYYGSSWCGAENNYKQPDMWCPLCGGSGEKIFNYYKDRCEARQRDPSQKVTCYPKCKMIKRDEDIKKRKTKITQKQYDRIKYLLGEKIYSLRIIADIVGVHRTTVSNINRIMQKQS